MTRNPYMTDCVGGRRAKAPRTSGPPRQAKGLNDPHSDGSLGVYHPSKHAHAVKPPRPKRAKGKAK